MREEAERNDAIWRAYCSGESQLSIAERYGISQQRVSQLIGDMRKAIGVEAREDRALREVAFLDHLRQEAMKIVEEGPSPVTVGTRGEVLRDPDTISAENPEGRIVRDHAGRLAAMNMAHQTSASIRKLLGLDAPTKTEITGGVRHELIGVDPEDLA